MHFLFKYQINVIISLDYSAKIRHISFCLFVQMERAVMEAFPALPGMSFGTSKKEMACERRTFALSILSGSGLFFPLFFIFTLIFK